MKILNRFNLSVIFEYECETIKECVLKAKESDADLRGANLCDADLCGANLCDANLRSANLCSADLRDANLRSANLCSADLRDANLCDADLCGANLCDANLCNADLCSADLRDANLCGANLCGADLRDAEVFDEKLTKNLIYINAGFNYQIWISDTKIKIGCQLHTTIAWSNFTDEEIKKMDGNKALEFWHKNKDIILAIAKHHQGDNK